MKNVGMRIRIEEELRESFVATCRLQGKVASNVLREFMHEYVVRESEGMQGGLFDTAPEKGRGMESRYPKGRRYERE